MNREKLITINNLSKTFLLEMSFWKKMFGSSGRSLTALDQVSFTLLQDRVLGIIGESGCGKTTLAKVMTQLESADEGEMYYKNNSENLLFLPEHEFKSYRSRIQMIFQNPYSALNPRLSTFQTLKEPLEIHRKGKNQYEEAVRLLNLVGLTPDYLERYPHEMSGGQRQRINIARALAVQPEILIADEPVSALDVSTQINILNLLKDIQEKYSLSFLFITHDLGIARYICDELLVMYLGQVVEWANVREFFKKPLHPYSEILIRSVPKIEEARDSKTAIIINMEKPAQGCLFAPRCPYVMEVCRIERPDLKGTFPRVRCLRYS